MTTVTARAERRASRAESRCASSAPATTRVTAQPRSRSRSASGKSGAAAYPSPTSRQPTGSWGSENGRPSGPVSCDPRAGGQAGQPGAADAGGLDDELDGRAVPADGLDPVDPVRAPGEVGAPRVAADRDGDERAGAEPLGDAGRDQREVAVGADPLGREHLAGDVQRAVTVPSRRRPAGPGSARTGPRRRTRCSPGAGSRRRRAGRGRRGGGDAADADQAEVGPDPVAQQPQHRPGTAAASGRPGEPAGADRLDRAPVGAQVRAGDRGVGGDDAVEAGGEGEVGDREHVVVGEVGGDLDQQRDPAGAPAPRPRRRCGARARAAARAARRPAGCAGRGCWAS